MRQSLIRRSQRDGKTTVLLHARASNWFSEMLGGSAKTVDQAFKAVGFLAKIHRTALIIDEVDSIATNRANLSSGDPTDVHRFVNAVLTGIDGLQGGGEFLLIATSNQQHMIDSAFLDRTSHRFYIGYLDRAAARAILLDQARVYRSANFTVGDELIQAVIDELYKDPKQAPELSGRDFSNLFHRTMTRFSTFRPSCAQLVSVARDHCRRTENGNARKPDQCRTIPTAE